MGRAQYNVLVLPFRQTTGKLEVAVLHRSDAEMWQFVAGGGEDDESPAETARREASEEAAIDEPPSAWIELDAMCTVPRWAFPTAPWPDDVYVVPEYCFAVEVGGHDIVLSREHDRYEWLEYEPACRRLTWDSNRTALWELTQRLQRQDR